jgi:hypothetical protein
MILSQTLQNIAAWDEVCTTLWSNAYDNLFLICAKEGFDLSEFLNDLQFLA